MYDFRMPLGEALLAYRSRNPNEAWRDARPHPGRRPAGALELGWRQPVDRAFGQRRGR